MTDCIPLLVATAGASAAVGVAGILFARGPHLRLRATALSLIAYGTLVSSALTFLLLALHFHSLTDLHIHNPLAELHEGLMDPRAIAVLLLTAILLSFAFFTNQGLARSLLRSCERREDVMASARLARSHPALSNLRLLVTRDREPDAYAFAVLRRSGLRLHPQDIIVVTKGLVDLLPPDEMEAALAHEVAHIRNGDNRYAPFFRVFSSLLFFDPLMRGFLGRFTRRSEFRADAEAARQTGKPLVLAQALFRLLASSRGPPAASGLLGGARPALLLQRIERLMAMARA